VNQKNKNLKANLGNKPFKMERMLKNLPWMISPFGSCRKEASMMIEESLKAMESAEN